MRTETKKKRLIMQFTASVGGVRRHVMDIAKGYDSEHFDIVGVFPDRSIAASLVGGEQRRYRAQFHALGLPFHVLEMPRHIAPLRDLISLFALFRLIRRLKPDVIHCHSTKAGLIGRIAAFLAGRVPVCYTPHIMYYALHTGWKRLLYYMVEKCLTPLTCALVAVSESECRELAKDFSFGSRLFLVNNGVLPCEGQSDTAAVRAGLGIVPDDILLLSPTRCEPQKDVRTLVRAMRIVCDAVPRACLLVAGDGDERFECEALARELGLEKRIHFLGWVDDLNPLLEAADMVVLSSRREGMPYALLEAAAYGKALVGTRVVGIQDCIVDGENGFLTPCGDAVAFAEKVILLCQDPDLRRCLGEGGKKLVREKFHRDNMVRQLEAVYARLAP